MHEAKAERSAKKAEKARAAVSRLQGEAVALQAQQAAATEQAGKPQGAAQQPKGPAPKGGAGMMKVVDEDRGIAEYVDYAAGDGMDVTLGMTVHDADALRNIAYANNLTRKMIADAKKAADAHAESAKREKRLADELAMDRQRMQTAFNMFRLRMVGMWVLANAMLVVLVNAYDVDLGGYATFVAGAVLYQIGFKLTGSVLYQAVRLLRWTFRRAFGWCYRIDRSETGVDRVVCCCRPESYFALDDVWEAEHPYEHA
jgi:hypothetical protein